MIVIQDTDKLQHIALAATIGFFDGVHLGHRFLINELKEVARLRNRPSAVITFPEHPRAVLHADYQPKLLNSFDEKITQLATTGVDYCIVLPFTPNLSLLSAKEFITSILKEKLHIETLLIGYDHKFGHNRSDSFEQYVDYGSACGIEVVQASVFDEGKTAVSSSEIRNLLIQGNVEKARHLLTYSYRIKGTIISGHKVGRTIGFPTANIQIDEPFKIVPGTGIYAVCALIRGTRYKGMLYIGNRPTLNNGAQISIEVNIFDFEADLYKQEIEVFFEYYIRSDVKFNGLEALRNQLANDREVALALLAN